MNTDEGAEDDAAQAQAAVEGAGLAAGRTPYTVAAAQIAAARGALAIGIANYPNTPLLAAMAHPIRLDTGPEPITGSTPMKAGTAPKVALNLLSTAVMVRLGHIHDGIMIDVQPSNAKLRTRATKIITQITICDPTAAEAALASSGGDVKLAILPASSLEAKGARSRLDASDGRRRDALPQDRNQKKGALSHPSRQ